MVAEVTLGFSVTLSAALFSGENVVTPRFWWRVAREPRFVVENGPRHS